MGIRGIKSGAELTVVQPGTAVVDRRAEPIDGVTAEQALVWRAVTAGLPADWIRPEALEVLAAYCRHVVAQKKIAALIQDEECSDEFDLSRYDTLLRMQDREGRALSSLATRLRITPQATYAAAKAKRQTTTKKPWSI